jgi:predicted esterase
VSGPAVIFESGISATCLNWMRVRAEVERFAHACSYDRAGLGWSDPSKSPRTTSTIIDELHALLEAAGIPQPHILVGYSFGGMFAEAGRYRLIRICDFHPMAQLPPWRLRLYCPVFLLETPGAVPDGTPVATGGAIKAPGVTLPTGRRLSV